MKAHSEEDLYTVSSMNILEQYVVISSLMQDVIEDYSDSASYKSRLNKIKEVAEIAVKAAKNEEAAEEFQDLIVTVDSELSSSESSNGKCFINSPFLSTTDISRGRTIKVIVYLENTLYNPEMSWIGQYLPKSTSH